MLATSVCSAKCWEVRSRHACFVFEHASFSMLSFSRPKADAAVPEDTMEEAPTQVTIGKFFSDADFLDP